MVSASAKLCLLGTERTRRLCMNTQLSHQGSELNNNQKTVLFNQKKTESKIKKIQMIIKRKINNKTQQTKPTVI